MSLEIDDLKWFLKGKTLWLKYSFKFWGNSMNVKTWVLLKAVQGKLPMWMYRFAGRKLGKVIDLKEDSEMTEELEGSKPWYRSKSILNGIVIVLIGTYETVRISLAPHFGWNVPAIPEFLYVILGAIGIYSRKVATTTIK